jgi:hypothetical protein
MARWADGAARGQPAGVSPAYRSSAQQHAAAPAASGSTFFRRFQLAAYTIKTGTFGQPELFDPKLTRHFLQYAQNTRRPTCAGVEN